jgi:hypothetical protein
MQGTLQHRRAHPVRQVGLEELAEASRKVQTRNVWVPGGCKQRLCLGHWGNRLAAVARAQPGWVSGCSWGRYQVTHETSRHLAL